MTPTSVAWRINAERLMLMAWPRAILLQLAHPLVAAGVEHSTFRSTPFAAAARLHHTVRAMLALTFGGDEARTAALDRIRAIHRRVNGELTHGVGAFAAGTRYSAEDPDLVLWVHATLLDSLPLVYTRVVAPLSVGELDAYCGEVAAVAVELGAREHEVPRSWAALQDYMQGMLGSTRIAVGAQARDIAGAVLSPPLAQVIWPAASLNRLVTVGLLPPRLREQYLFTWRDRDDRRLGRVLRAIRAARAVAPLTLAYWPEARRDRRRTRLPSAR